MTRCICSLVTLIALMASTVQAQDFSNVKSGLLLGIYASPAHGGMRVSGLIPGYSAEGRLFPGDVLMRTTVDGYQIYNLRSSYEMENAKIAIGANQQAGVEIWRPGVGMLYAWVEFTPIGGIGAYTYGSGQQPACRAQFRMESEKPGARQLFQRNRGPMNQDFGQGQPHRQQFQQPGRQQFPQSTQHGAAKLFNR